MNVSSTGAIPSYQMSPTILTQSRLDGETPSSRTLWQEAKDFNTTRPVLSAGFITSISSFLAGLTTKTTIQYLPLTFLPALMAFMYEFFFPSNKGQTINHNQGEEQGVEQSITVEEPRDKAAA